MENKYTPIHNWVFEKLATMNLSPYETRVLFAIWRKTYGYIDKEGQRKKDDYVSVSQLVEFTKLDKGNIGRALRGLIKKNIIFRHKKRTGFNSRLKLSVETTNPVSRDNKSLSVETDTKEKKEIIKEITSGDRQDDNTKEWQKRALIAEEFLHVKVPVELRGQWFKFFRDIEGTPKEMNLSRALSYAVDHPSALTGEDKVMLIFSLVHNGFKQL